MSGGLLAPLGDVVPLTRKQTFVAGVATGAMFFPMYGLVSQTFSTLAVAYGQNDTPAKALSTVVGLGLAPFLLGRWQLLNEMSPPQKKKYRGLRIGPVRATETDLCTGMLVLGATGTGKTSRVLLPAVEDFFNTYNVEDPDVYSKDPFQKLGGYCIEVKGKFFEVMVTLAHRAGRNASTDVRVIRANSTLPVVEFKDEHGRKFLLNGQPCSTGSEVSLLYKGYKFKSGEAIESTLFKRIRLQDLEKKEEELREMAVKVHDDVRFIGWRWKAGKLHRVKQTLKKDTPEFTGEVIVAPKKLYYVKTLHLSNGLRYNLIDPRVPSSEAAERISMVAKMTTGEGKNSGGNEYFYQAASKTVEAAIRLQRIISPKTEVTVLEINRLIAHESALHAALNILSSIKVAMQQKKTAAEKGGDNDGAYELSKTILSYDDLGKFFTEEWLKLKATPTGSSIQSTITNLFGPFMRDPQLAETFCTPATFSFDECMQKGTVFCFVPGSEYEMLSRTLGTVLKMDWQSRMLRRVSEGSDSLNKNRLVLHVADECQAFIISGSQDAGDPKFMSLSRESRVVNICATQSEAWVYSAISQNEARVWLQSFGTRVWLTQTDMETNKRASELCGMIKKEKRTHTQQLHVGDLVQGKEGTAKQQMSYEEKQRYEPHEYTQLKNDEAICFNKGEGLLDVGMGDCKAMKAKIPWRWITSDAGAAIIADRMRWWFCEVWENDLCNAGRTGLMDTGGPEIVDDPLPVLPLESDPDGVLPQAVIPAAPPSTAPQAAVAPTAPLSGTATPPPASGAAQPPAAPPPSAPPASAPPAASAPSVPPGPPPPPATSGAPPASGLQQKREDPPVTKTIDAGDLLAKAGQHPLGKMTPPGGDLPVQVDSVKDGKDPSSGTPLRAAPIPPNTDAAPTAEAPPPSAPAGEKKLTPAELAKQERAYKELIEGNPFLLVTYEDVAGVEKSRALARQRSEMPPEDVAVTASGGMVAGNKGIVRDAAEKAGAKADTFRAPADLVDANSAGAELNRRTVEAISGKLAAPDAVKTAAGSLKEEWVNF